MIVMVNTDPRDGPELGAPFFQATVVAAMEYEVEVILTDLIPEIEETVGGAYVIQQAMDDDVVTFTY